MIPWHGFSLSLPLSPHRRTVSAADLENTFIWSAHRARGHRHAADWRRSTSDGSRSWCAAASTTAFPFHRYIDASWRRRRSEKATGTGDRGEDPRSQAPKHVGHRSMAAERPIARQPVFICFAPHPSSTQVYGLGKVVRGDGAYRAHQGGRAASKPRHIIKAASRADAEKKR